MKVAAIVWLGVRTERFAETASLFRDAIALEPHGADAESVRFRLENGTTTSAAPTGTSTSS